MRPRYYVVPQQPCHDKVGTFGHSVTSLAITAVYQFMSGLTVECRVVVQQSQLLVLSDLQEGLGGG